MKILIYNYIYPLIWIVKLILMKLDSFVETIADIYLWCEYQVTSFPAKYEWWKCTRYNGNDEFHSSYDMRLDIIMRLNNVDRNRYIENLIKRRNAAHHKDLELKDAKSKL